MPVVMVTLEKSDDAHLIQHPSFGRSLGLGHFGEVYGRRTERVYINCHDTDPVVAEQGLLDHLNIRLQGTLWTFDLITLHPAEGEARMASLKQVAAKTEEVRQMIRAGKQYLLSCEDEGWD